MSELITRARVEKAAEAIQKRTTHIPTVGLILGSGLSGLADELGNADIIPVD